MKNKLLILSIFILLFTGCTVNYEIEIIDNKLIETFDVSEKEISKAKLEDDIGSSFRSKVLFYGNGNEIPTNYYSYISEGTCKSCEAYTKEFIDSDDEVAIILNGTHLFDDFEDSTIINNFMSNVDIDRSDDLLTLSYNGDWSFLESYNSLDEVNITIKTDYEVLNNNANKVSGNKYIWNIKNGEKTNGIHISVNTSKIVDSDSINNGNKIDLKTTIIIILVILLIILISLLIMYSLYQKKSNINRL